jgi:hypothetical protein
LADKLDDIKQNSAHRWYYVIMFENKWVDII